MGNMIVSLKNTTKAVVNMTTEFVKESINSSNYTTTTSFLSIFSNRFKNSSSYNRSARNFQPELQPSEGLKCILDDTNQFLYNCFICGKDLTGQDIYI